MQENVSANGKDVFTISKPNLGQTISAHMIFLMNWLYSIRTSTAVVSRLRSALEDPAAAAADAPAAPAVASNNTEPAAKRARDAAAPKRKPIPLECLRVCAPHIISL